MRNVNEQIAELRDQWWAKFGDSDGEPDITFAEYLAARRVVMWETVTLGARAVEVRKPGDDD